MNNVEKIKIAQKEEEVLRKIAKDVPLDKIKSAEIKNIIKNLKKAIMENDDAIAVAAPQINQSLRIFAVSEYVFAKLEEKKEKKEYGSIVFINPKILKESRKQNILTEGCLSVKNIYGTIRRAEKIKVEAYDENGKKLIKSGSDLFAQVIQHEIDHLNGCLFVDKAIELKKI